MPAGAGAAANMTLTGDVRCPASNAARIAAILALGSHCWIGTQLPLGARVLRDEGGGDGGVSARFEVGSRWCAYAAGLGEPGRGWLYTTNASTSVSACGTVALAVCRCARWVADLGLGHLFEGSAGGLEEGRLTGSSLDDQASQSRAELRVTVFECGTNTVGGDAGCSLVSSRCTESREFSGATITPVAFGKSSGKTDGTRGDIGRALLDSCAVRGRLGRIRMGVEANLFCWGAVFGRGDGTGRAIGIGPSSIALPVAAIAWLARLPSSHPNKRSE